MEMVNRRQSLWKVVIALRQLAMDLFSDDERLRLYVCVFVCISDSFISNIGEAEIAKLNVCLLCTINNIFCGRLF